ncbi:MAG: sigma-70 family RNA polymerase sigma factor [Thermoguttaceae bacterium]|nr:sigma-70 family RNA polymerase sigma factor [Thermoguttaceae bacterium]
MNAIGDARDSVSYLFEFTDEELVGEYRFFGDHRCFEELVRRYAPELKRFFRWRFGFREDQIEEVAQLVFLRVWRNLDRFDLTKRFRPWFFRVARNRAVDFAREQGRKTSVSLDAALDDDERFTRGACLEARDFDLSRESDLWDVRAALAQLPTKFRLVLELVFFQGWTMQMVGDALGVAASTVARRVSRALKELSKFFLERPSGARARGFEFA